ncbi:MAG: CbiX/SirB N-terminal domain-containing protein [Nitrospira sp.]|nr:CbiX/SirB N-terminal domain-containing protein [Nitrospira sp.]MCP9443380.1 CbiX/SirB N-terminal domain-containing protein [Nitrospira sp.]
MKFKILTKTLTMFVALAALCVSAAPGRAVEPHAGAKIGVLLVNHGSRSETWRNSLLQLESSVTPSLLAVPSVKGVKTAFMEYTEPSIATRMKEFDQEGFTDVIIVPVFLTVSPHTFDDIPTIVGLKEDPHSMQKLKIENIQRYTSKATPHITPPLDFTDILQKNLLRRVTALSRNPADEGLVLIGYGDETYDKEWVDLFDKAAGYVRQHTGIAWYSYGWCGHIANYKPEETTAAINTVLKHARTALVIPVLVAHDEQFQIKIIGDGIAKVPDHKNRVLYKPDSILPDPNIERWVVSVTDEYVRKIQSQVSRAN